MTEAASRDKRTILVILPSIIGSIRGSARLTSRNSGATAEVRLEFLGAVYGVEDVLDIVARAEPSRRTPSIAARNGNKEMEQTAKWDARFGVAGLLDRFQITVSPDERPRPRCEYGERARSRDLGSEASARNGCALISWNPVSG